MKIAVLSDIHGNYYALEEVLKIAKTKEVKKILVLGDIVGYYYYPEKVLKQLGTWDYLLIKGNHEEILLDILNGKIDEGTLRLKYGSGHRLAIEKLSKKQLDILTQAPEKLLVEIDGVNIQMCHGSPWESDYYLYPNTPNEILDKCEQEDIDIVLVGHSHYPFTYQAGNTLLVNVGSIGQSRVAGGIASWAIIDTSNKDVQLMATPYNVNSLIEEIEKTDPDIIYLKNILTRNKV